MMIKDGFKRKIKGYIDLIRPFTLLAPIIVSICIMCASYFYNDISMSTNQSIFNIIIPASISLAILNGASNALNQAADINSDKLSKYYRPIPRGDVSIFEAKIISIILYFISFYISITVNLLFLLEKRVTLKSQIIYSE